VGCCCGTAFQQFLIWANDLRIDQPEEDICIFSNDISASFHHVFHHPVMMVVIASTFLEHLNVPAGSIFGGASSLSCHMQLEESQSFLLTAFCFLRVRTVVTDWSVLSTAPTLEHRALFSWAHCGSCNPVTIAVSQLGCQTPNSSSNERQEWKW
jgi:hypothetical protein